MRANDPLGGARRASRHALAVDVTAAQRRRAHDTWRERALPLQRQVEVRDGAALVFRVGSDRTLSTLAVIVALVAAISVPVFLHDPRAVTNLLGALGLFALAAYVLFARATIRLDGEALEIRRPLGIRRRFPLRSIERVHEVNRLGFAWDLVVVGDDLFTAFTLLLTNRAEALLLVDALNERLRILRNAAPYRPSCAVEGA